jgi:drug/metabolite transporter (DMT)-like permease
MTAMRPAGQPPGFKIVLAFAAVYVIWGSTYLAIKVGIETIPPFFMAGARFLIAGTILYLLARRRGAPPATRQHWAAASVVGALLLLGGNGALVWSEQRVPSGLAALLLATIPIWMVLLDSLARRDGQGTKLDVRILSGLAIGIAGLALLVGPAKLWGSTRVDLAGASVLMLGSLSWSVGSLYSRQAKLPTSPFLAAAMEMLAGGALLAVLGFLTGEASQIRTGTISSASLLALAYLIAFGSLLGFTAYIWLLGVSSTARVSTYAYVNPVVAVFLGWAFAGETLSARILIATLAIVAAVALILSHRPRPVAVAPDTEGLPTSEEERALGIGENDKPVAEERSRKSEVRSQNSEEFLRPH